MSERVDWKKLKHGTGPATRVPAQIKQLAGKAGHEAEEAFDILRSTLVGKRKWYAASEPAMTLLLEALPRATFKSSVLVLLAEMAGADHVRGWLAPFEDTPPAQIVRAMASGKDSLLAELRSKDANARAAAPVALAMLPSLASESVPALVRTAEKDADDVVRASAILALGRLGEKDAEVRRLVEAARAAKSDPVRGAAGLSALRMDPSLSLGAAADEIEAWLRWPAPRKVGTATELPWFGGLLTAWYSIRANERFGEKEFLLGPSLGILELARHRGSEADLLALALDRGSSCPSGVLTRNLGELVLELSGFTSNAKKNDPHPFVALPAELTAEQRGVAKRLASSPLRPAAGFGLPASGLARRRWLALESAGPLDRPVTVEIKKAKRTLPFWRAWQDLVRAGIRGQPFPPAIAETLRGADRWDALAEAAAGAYGGQPPSFADSDVEREVASVASDRGLLVRAGLLADDLSVRVVAARAEGNPAFVGAAPKLLLLPFVRAGRPIEARWDVIVPVSPGALTREILLAIPPARREALVWERVRVRPPTDIVNLGAAVEILDLVPSKRIAENLIGRLRNDRVKRVLEGEVVTHMKRITELAKKHPALAEALRPAK